MDDDVAPIRIPIVRQLLECGHEFTLRQAVALLERGGLRPPTEGGVGSYVIRPSPELSFPAGEIRRCSLDQCGRLVIETDVFALYGGGSPLPHYWIERTAVGEGGERVRQFLDWINARVYSALCAGWRSMHGGLEQAAWPHAFATLSSRGGGGAYVTGGVDLFRGRQPTRAGVRRLVQRITGRTEVQVYDRQPASLRLSLPQCRFGTEEGSMLGGDLCLGRTLAVSSGLMQIRIGPADELTAVALGPGSGRGRALCRWLSEYLGDSHRVDIEVMVRRGSRRPWRLGTDSKALGLSAWLGDHAPRDLPIRMIHAGSDASGSNTKG